MMVLPPLPMVKAMWLLWIFVFLISVGYLQYPSFAKNFTFNQEIKDSLFVSILLMNLHKFESYYQKEWVHTKIFGSNSLVFTRESAQRLIYITFVGTFLLMLIPAYLVLNSSTTQALVFLVWSAQGYVELHHLAKTIFRGYYYPGTFTGLLFFFYQNSTFLPIVINALKLPDFDYNTIRYTTGTLGVLVFYLFLVEEMFRPSNLPEIYNK